MQNPENITKLLYLQCRSVILFGTCSGIIAMPRKTKELLTYSVAPVYSSNKKTRKLLELMACNVDL